LSIALITGFIFNENRTNHPLVPLEIFKVRNVTGGNLMMVPVYASMYGMFFLLSLYIQTVMHYSPVMTGLSFLPFPIIMGITSTQVSGWVSKYGFKRFLIIGPLIVTLSILFLVHLPINGNYFINILPTALLMPLGIGMTYMPIIAAATSGVRSDRAGLAAGLINTSQQMGGAFGLSILSSVAASVTAASGNLGTVASLVHGYDRAFQLAVLFMFMAIILAVTVIKQKKRSGNDREESSYLEGIVSFE
jgi:predicted MFS family arabinose efflux permease